MLNVVRCAVCTVEKPVRSFRELGRRPVCSGCIFRQAHERATRERAPRKKSKLSPLAQFKQAVRWVVNAAVKAGILIKPKECQRCGSTEGRIEGHHEDYRQPLAVEWVCRRCHVLLDRALEARGVPEKGHSPS